MLIPAKISAEMRRVRFKQSRSRLGSLIAPPPKRLEEPPASFLRFSGVSHGRDADGFLFSPTVFYLPPSLHTHTHPTVFDRFRSLCEQVLSGSASLRDPKTLPQALDRSSPSSLSPPSTAEVWIPWILWFFFLHFLTKFCIWGSTKWSKPCIYGLMLIVKPMSCCSCDLFRTRKAEEPEICPSFERK